MAADRRQKIAFTLIEFLIALVIIGFIVAILVGVFSSPLKQAKTDSAIAQVKDGLRQASDAISLSAARGNATCCSTGKLVEDGLLSAKPAIPAGIDAGSTPEYTIGSDENYRIGGCGDNVGDPVTVTIRLTDISDAFCVDYNAAHGITGIGKNCTDGSCAANTVNPDGAPEATSSITFCYNDAADGYNAIVYNTGVPGGASLFTSGISACP